MTKNLYTLLKKETGEITVQLSQKDHPIFLAHFPNYPILPGFLLIEIFCEVLEENPKKIRSAKFISHSHPEDILTYVYEKKGEKTKIKVTNQENTKVGEIVYE